MWMLGCILYELCMLRRPFEGDSLNQVLHKITKESYKKLPNDFEPIYHKLIEVLL
jgi:NIMA (never in mitosis gene a)-related kinase